MHLQVRSQGRVRREDYLLQVVQSAARPAQVANCMVALELRGWWMELIYKFIVVQGQICTREFWDSAANRALT
eukprot:234837-Amphidinium_carterae.1